MDQLWKELKGDLAADRQFRNIDEAVDYAEQWVLRLTNNQALQKAGVFSKSPLGGPGSFGTAGFCGAKALAHSGTGINLRLCSESLLTGHFDAREAELSRAAVMCATRVAKYGVIGSRANRFSFAAV